MQQTRIELTAGEKQKQELEGSVRLGHSVSVLRSLDCMNKLLLFASLLILVKSGFCHVLSRRPAAYILITFPFVYLPREWKKGLRVEIYGS